MHKLSCKHCSAMTRQQHAWGAHHNDRRAVMQIIAHNEYLMKVISKSECHACIGKVTYCMESHISTQYSDKIW